MHPFPAVSHVNVAIPLRQSERLLHLLLVYLSIYYYLSFYGFIFQHINSLDVLQWHTPRQINALHLCSRCITLAVYEPLLLRA